MFQISVFCLYILGCPTPDFHWFIIFSLEKDGNFTPNSAPYLDDILNSTGRLFHGNAGIKHQNMELFNTFWGETPAQLWLVLVSFGGPGIHQLWFSSANLRTARKIATAMTLHQFPFRCEADLIVAAIGCFKAVASNGYPPNSFCRIPPFWEIPRLVASKKSQVGGLATTKWSTYPRDRNCLILVNVTPQLGGSSHLVSYIPGKWDK